MSRPASEQDVRAAAQRARDAAAELAATSRQHKDDALEAMADALADSSDEILAANSADLSAAYEAGTAESLIDRLTLDENRVTSMARGLREVAALPDRSVKCCVATSRRTGLRSDRSGFRSVSS